MTRHHPPVLQIVGHANSGKTTLITQLVAQLSTMGYRVGTIKHHSGKLELDTRGKDSWLHREAGAVPVTLVSQNQTAVYYSQPRSLAELLLHYSQTDLVLVEGFKRENYPKWALLKTGESLDWLEELTYLEAVVVSEPVGHFPYDVYYTHEVGQMARMLSRKIDLEKG
ncbi:molybdopterin-guanine dinucleotide biosynthesis protein B [Marininema mesophilum]|uniref:Molybdopterin-guanine dinucleotide biosynthesis protein B n=1 Tax=Marininema mesophilum TaxID=1048340 RepID=A0A1H2SDW0_9BACL|nr:molybdopterin-guanine dinucleotide biosynthesis protein B [Marininema mesophilum]SDW29314.1 molybdopterin-guanine dinucleotide biosynthesis protein B [Marininema mesophilum]